MPINANARNYLDYQLQYVPDYQDPLKKYRARQERLEEELDRIGIEDPTERNRIRREYLGNEPINEGGFFSEQLPRSAARGGLGLVENIGSVGEYLGDVTDLDVVKEPFGALARTFRREKEELDPAYDSEDPGVSDYVNMAVESGLASAPAMVAPMGGARLGFLGARSLLGAGGKEVSKRALMGSAIGGGFVGGSASNAGLEGGTTYSQVKEQMLQQGFSDREAEREARRQADYVATQNLGANPELLGYNVAQSFSGPAGKLLGGATGRANAMRRMGVGSALEGLQEGAQYEVQQQAAGNMDANRFLDQEGRTSMIVGAISDLPFSAIDVALPDPNYQKVDSRVDPEASALKRSQEAAYAQVAESDRLEAQRQEEAQRVAAQEEAERIQKFQAEEEARQRKEQVQREKEALEMMKLREQALRERLKTANEIVKSQADSATSPAPSAATPTAEQLFSFQQEQRRNAAEQTAQIPVPSSPTTTTAPSTADLLAIQQEQQRVAQERAQQATEQQQQQQPEADPEPTIDLAAYEAIQEQERLKEEEAQRVMEMRQQWEDNLRKRQEVLLLPAPAETSASTTEEGPTFQSPRTQELYEQFKTRRRNEATQELRNVDQSQEAQQETFQTPEGQALYDQFKAEKRQQMEQLGMVETPAPMETTQEDVTTTPEEDTLSTEVAGQDLVQDQTEPVVEETAAPMQQELEDIPAEVYVSTREPKPSTILATGGQNDLTNGEFDDIYLTSVENYKSPEHGNIKLFELSSGETVPLKKISTKKEAEKYGVPSVGWYRMDKSKDSTDRVTGEVITEPMRLTNLNLKDLEAVTQELIDYRNNRQVDFLNLGTLLGNQRTTYVEYLNRQKTDKAETEPVVEETAPLPKSLPEETLEPTPADELKSDLLRKKEAATQAYEAMDESLFGTKEEDKLDAAMEKADRAYERGLTKAQKEWDKLSANTGKKGTLAPNQLQNAERRTKKLFEDAGLRRSQADPLVYTQKLIEFGKDEMANTTPGEADVVQGRKREEMEDDFGMDDSSGGGMYSGYGDSNQYYDDTDTDLTSEIRYSYSATSRPTNAAGPSTKLTARQVKAAMEGVKSVLKKLDPNGDKVTVVANKDEAVAKLREMNRNRMADQLANDKGTEGFTITSTGEIFLVADQIEGGNLREAVDRMVEVTFHEALGHAGLRGLMGDNFGKFVKNFGVKNGKKINEWLKTSEGKPYSNNDRTTQIEEYIARNFAEKGVQDVQFLENLVQNVMSFFGLRKYSETALKQAMIKVQDAYLDRGGDIINGAQQTEQDNTEQEGQEQTEESTAPQPEKPRPTRTVQYKPPRGLEKSTKYMDFADQAYALFGRYNSPEDVQKAIAEFVVRKKDKESLLTYENLDQIGEILRKNREFKERAEGGIQAEIRASRRPNVLGGDVPLSQWETPLESKTNNFLYKMQDKMIDTKEVIKAIKKSGKDITDRWNAYLQEELYHGRTAKETADFLKRELEPLMEALRKSNTTIPDFETYLWNRHAQERNEQIARVNPKMPDKGSGLTTAEAQTYLKNLSPAQRKTFETLAQKIDAITAKTREVLKDASLESQDTIDRWEGVYDYYVPLEREEFDFSPVQQGLGIGQGMDVRGSATKRATGSGLAVKDILANVALQRERAITRKHKNRVAQAVYGLAAQNPNPDFWLVIDPANVKDPDALAQELADMGIDPNEVENIAKEPVTTTIDKRSGLVTRKVNASLRNSDNFLSTRINGENKFIIFNAKNPISQRMVQSLKNLDADQLGTGMGIAANITRYMASINTQYNPIFGVVNLVRDVQGAAFNLSSTPLAGMQGEVARNLPSALRGVYSNLRNERNRNRGKTPLAENEFSTLYEEFQQEGGQTGYRDQFVRRDERAIELQKMLDPGSWADSSLGKVFTIDGKLKVPMETARQKAKPLFDWLTDYNETMENAIRLSAYKAAKDQGMSVEQAASLAKNLTVNFNRKGQIATQAGALYSFFNAAVQGTARLHETMKGPAGNKILAGGMLLGVGQAVALALAGFDEDEPPYFVRERNLIIPTFVGSGYLTIPMPLGLHVIPNTGRILAEFALSGGKDFSKRVVQFTGSILDAFNPIGNAGWSVQTFAPTPFDPLVALSENRDWTGKPIAREDMVSTRPSPGYTRAKDTASWLSEKLAYGFNIMSGGTDYKKGFFSPTPDQLDYLIGQATGGVGREALKLMQTGQTIYTGEELPPYKIPLAGRFYGNTESSAAESNRFYSNITRLNEHEAEIKGRRENRGNPGEYIRDNPESRLVDFAGKIENEVRKLRKRKRDLMERNASRSSIETIEKLITRRMKSLNDRVRQYQ